MIFFSKEGPKLEACSIADYKLAVPARITITKSKKIQFFLMELLLLYGVM
jgi:hypothetical protein